VNGVAELLGSLRKAGAHEQAARLTAAGLFELFLGQNGPADQFRFGRETDGTPAVPWGWEDLHLWPVPDRGTGRTGAALRRVPARPKLQTESEQPRSHPTA